MGLIHGREDYQQIQDPSGRIPADMPVFLLLASDEDAPEFVRLWAERQRSKPGGDKALAALAWAHAERMTEWQRRHGSKAADLPADGAGQPADRDKLRVLLVEGRKLAASAGAEHPLWALLRKAQGYLDGKSIEPYESREVAIKACLDELQQRLAAGA